MHEDPHGVMARLELLMSGRGYNFYDKRNLARADDLLVRARASGFLGDAGQALTALEPEFRRRFVPASTRENPYPPAEAMAKLKDIGLLRGRIGDIETAIRSMSVPTQDKVWCRFREERTLLEQLASFDLQLVLHCQEIADQTRAITPDDWNTRRIPSEFDPRLRDLQDCIRQRQQFLSIQVI
jgi:hypothetical protein